MKKKSNKSKFDRGRFFLRYFSTDDVVIACEEQFFFKHFSLLFVARTVLSLSLARLNFYVCARFFFLEAVESATTPWAMERGRSCFPFTGFFPDITSYFVFFLLAQFIGLFFPRIFPSSSGPDATRLDVRQDVAMATIDGVSLEERNGVIRPVF